MRKSLSKRLTFFATCFLAICLVTGCKKKEDAPSAVPSPKVVPKLEAKVNAAIQKPVSTAKFAAGSNPITLKGKKDPFKPLITPPEAAAAKAPLPGRVKLVDALPIQSHDSSQFTVTGIIVGLKDNKALVVDPTGKGYVVKPGMLIGSNEGRITKITASSVEITEYYSDNKKKVKSRRIVLPLAKKSKETSR